MNLHVTGEIMQHNIGGIATVIDQIYYHSKNSQILFVHKNIDMDLKLPNDIKTCSISKLNSYMKDVKYDNIIFHNFIIFKEWLKNNTINNNCYYVMHSNTFMEKNYKYNNFSDENVDDMFYIVQNTNVITISEYERKMLLKICKRKNITPKNILVIENGLNFKDENKYENNITNNFGYIGRMDFRKGLTFLYKYWDGIKLKLLVASGGYEKYNNLFFEELCSLQSKNIIHLGYCSGKRKDNFFKNIDALIIPSIYEPFGMVLLECIDNNKLPICNKHGGMLEILGEDYPFYFNIEDKESLYLCLSNFIKYPNKQELLFKIKEHVSNKYSIQKMIDKYDNL